MPVVLFVIGFPVGDHCHVFVQVVKGIHVRAFIQHPVIERLDETISPWLTWKYVVDAHFLGCEFIECLGNEAGLAIAPDN